MVSADEHGVVRMPRTWSMPTIPREHFERARRSDSGSASLSTPADWERYWRSRWVTSFAEQFPDNYDGPIREFWQYQLQGHLDEVLDVACGNGALTWIADEILNHSGRTRATRITGIDSAAIDPFRALGKARTDHPNVRFIGNVAAETLPFPDRSVDLVMSQYGIEYTDIEKSIPEVGRVLKSPGRMAFIVHNAESSVVRDATMHLEAFRAVMQLRIHDFALDLFELGRRLRTPLERQTSPAFKALTTTLDDLTAQVRLIVKGHTHRSAIHKYMDELMQVFAYPGARAGGGKERIVAARDAFCAHVRKMEHMRAAALSDAKRERLVALVEESGYAVTEVRDVAYRHEKNIGTAIVAVGRRRTDVAAQRNITDRDREPCSTPGTS